ncbi:MAG: alpha/beta hydrolase [Halioglobus sp.]
MLQTLKVFLLRKFYRLASAYAWKGHTQDKPYSTFHASGPNGPIALRAYLQDSGADKPMIIYFHGGGWVIGDLDTHHPICQRLSDECGCTLIAVDYRLAPEHPFPAAQDDALAATTWIAEHCGELGPSNGEIILAGDSAGGHLAIATAVELPEDVSAGVVGKIAIYPVTDHYTIDRVSYVEKGKGYALSKNLMVWFWDTYLAGNENPSDRAFPLRSTNLSKLPRSMVITAEHDPLRDEGKAYAEALQAAGVDVAYSNYPNAQHGFAGGQGPIEDCESLLGEISQWVNGSGR